MGRREVCAFEQGEVEFVNLCDLFVEKRQIKVGCSGNAVRPPNGKAFPCSPLSRLRFSSAYYHSFHSRVTEQFRYCSFFQFHLDSVFCFARQSRS